MKIIIVENYDELSQKAFEVMKKVVTSKENPVLGLATGSSPIGLYKCMIADHKENGTDYSKVTTFNLDEYVGLADSHPQSYRYFMNNHLFLHVDINLDKTHVPGNKGDENDLSVYDENIKKHGGIDLQLLGIGSNGHIAFNEPFTSLSSRTGVRALTEDTLIVNSRVFGGDPEKVPKTALSVGVGTVCDSKQVLLLISGHNKARALRHCVEGGVDHAWTISALQMHPDGIVACDEAACGELKVDTYKYFKEIYKDEK